MRERGGGRGGLRACYLCCDQIISRSQCISLYCIVGGGSTSRRTANGANMVPISPMQQRQQQQQVQLTSPSSRRAVTASAAASPFRQSASRNMSQSGGRMEEATGGTCVFHVFFFSTVYSASVSLFFLLVLLFPCHSMGPRVILSEIAVAVLFVHMYCFALSTYL